MHGLIGLPQLAKSRRFAFSGGNFVIDDPPCSLVCASGLLRSSEFYRIEEAVVGDFHG